MRAIRTASICHNEDDATNPRHRRVRLALHRDIAGQYRWENEDGDDIGLPASFTVAQAMDDLHTAYGSSVWALRAGR